MKALSIHPYYAMAIVSGQKSIECRTWKTEYRGDLLICSTAKKLHGTIPGHALGVVTLEDIVPFEKKHLKDALMAPADFSPGLYAWKLTYNRLIVPVPVKGKLSLWEYDGPLDYIPENEWILPEGEDLETGGPDDWLKKYWQPIMI